MDSITININGDFHISVTPDSAGRLARSGIKPIGCSKSQASKDTYKALVSSLEDYLKDSSNEYDLFEYGAEDDDIDCIVAVLYPGKPPKIMTESESFDTVERYGHFDSVLSVEDKSICACLKGAYDPATVLTLGDDRYIIGPVVVYACDEDGDSVSLSAEELMAAIVYFDNHTVTLCADGEDLPSFII